MDVLDDGRQYRVHYQNTMQFLWSVDPALEFVVDASHVYGAEEGDFPNDSSADLPTGINEVEGTTFGMPGVPANSWKIQNGLVVDEARVATARHCVNKFKGFLPLVQGDVFTLRGKATCVLLGLFTDNCATAGNVSSLTHMWT